MVASQCHRRLLVGSRCAPQSEINPARKQRGQRPELFRNHQWRMIGQHDTARSDSYGLCALRNMTDQYRCCARCDAFHIVVLGQPKTRITHLLGRPCQTDAVCKCIGRRVPLSHHGQIENGKRNRKRHTQRYTSLAFWRSNANAGCAAPGLPPHHLLTPRYATRCYRNDIHSRAQVLEAYQRLRVAHSQLLQDAPVKVSYRHLVDREF